MYTRPVYKFESAELPLPSYLRTSRDQESQWLSVFHSKTSAIGSPHDSTYLGFRENLLNQYVRRLATEAYISQALKEKDTLELIS